MYFFLTQNLTVFDNLKTTNYIKQKKSIYILYYNIHTYTLLLLFFFNLLGFIQNLKGLWKCIS